MNKSTPCFPIAPSVILHGEGRLAAMWAFGRNTVSADPPSKPVQLGHMLRSRHVSTVAPVPKFELLDPGDPPYPRRGSLRVLRAVMYYSWVVSGSLYVGGVAFNLMTLVANDSQHLRALVDLHELADASLLGPFVALLPRDRMGAVLIATTVFGALAAVIIAGWLANLDKQRESRALFARQIMQAVLQYLPRDPDARLEVQRGQ
jgi:hypothetical protein